MIQVYIKHIFTKNMKVLPEQCYISTTKQLPEALNELINDVFIMVLVNFHSLHVWLIFGIVCLIML